MDRPDNRTMTRVATNDIATPTIAHMNRKVSSGNLSNLVRMTTIVKEAPRAAHQSNKK
jgi:hypothetical protein